MGCLRRRRKMATCSLYSASKPEVWTVPSPSISRSERDPTPALSVFWNQRASLSPEMAILIEKASGVSMETLMRMQNSFDIAAAPAE